MFVGYLYIEVIFVIEKLFLTKWIWVGLCVFGQLCQFDYRCHCPIVCSWLELAGVLTFLYILGIHNNQTGVSPLGMGVVTSLQVAK